MAHIEGEIVIARPVEAVFDFVADECNEPAYNPGLARVDQITEGSLGAGTRFAASARMMGRPVEMVIEYTAYDRPHRLSSTTVMSTAEVSGTLTFEPDLEGTRMRWSWELRPHGVLTLLSPVLAAVGNRQERRIWAGLKQHLESAVS